MARKHIYIAPIVDCPYTERATEYLAAELDSMPLMRPIETSREFINYLYEIVKIE